MTAGEKSVCCVTGRSWQQVRKVSVEWSSLPTWWCWIMTAGEKSVLCDGAGSQQHVRKACVVWQWWITTAGGKSVCCVMVLDHDGRWEKCVLSNLPTSVPSDSARWASPAITIQHSQVTHTFFTLIPMNPACSVCKNEIGSSATRARLVIHDVHGVRRVTMNLTNVPVVVTCGIWRVTINFMNVPVSLTCVAFEGWPWTSWMCLYPSHMWHLKGDSEVHQCAYILDLCGIWRVAVNFMNAPVSLTHMAFEGWRWTSQMCVCAFQNEAAEVDVVWGDQSDPEGKRWCSQQRQWRLWGEASLTTRQHHSKCIEGFICGFIFNPFCKIWVALKCGKFGSLYLVRLQRPEEQRCPFLPVCVCAQIGMVGTVWNF